jgi:hypothetical protein
VHLGATAVVGLEGTLAHDRLRDLWNRSPRLGDIEEVGSGRARDAVQKNASRFPQHALAQVRRSRRAAHTRYLLYARTPAPSKSVIASTSDATRGGKGRPPLHGQTCLWTKLWLTWAQVFCHC